MTIALIAAGVVAMHYGYRATGKAGLAEAEERETGYAAGRSGLAFKGKALLWLALVCAFIAGTMAGGL